MDPSIFIGILFILIGFVYIYNRTWRNPEGFEEAKGKPTEKKEEKLRKEEEGRDKVIMEQNLNPPYAVDPINSVDDYEYNLIFQNEGDRGITKAQRDLLMSSYPMDWSVQPPSSELFQKGMAAFKESFANPTPQPSGNPYKQVDGSNMTPPDTLQNEMKEREILSTYVPKKPNELTTYDASDVKDIIQRIYDSKGMVADYKQTGKNVYTVIGTRRKDEKILYEDEEAAVTGGPNPAAGEKSAVSPGGSMTVGEGEAEIVVPAIATEVQAGLDPFFSPSTTQKTRDGKWDYTRWTPGLERAFAPSESRSNWF
jgi:hypothetical protein